MTDFIIYAMCPHCMVMHGPFASDAQRAQFYDNVHPGKCQGTKQIPKAHRATVAASKVRHEEDEDVYTKIGGVPVITPKARSYSRGDISRPFGSNYDGTCYDCGFGYNTGDFICMVTVTDGEKGKAMHEDCAELFRKRLDAESTAGQSDEPPF